MAGHIPDKRAICDHDAAGSHRNGEGNVKSVVRRMVDGQTDGDCKGLEGRCKASMTASARESQIDADTEPGIKAIDISKSKGLSAINKCPAPP